MLKKKKCKIVIAKSNNRTHPVIGIWSISLKKSLSNILVKENIKKIDLFIKKHNFSIVKFSYDKIDSFFNINTYRDLDKAKKISISSLILNEEIKSWNYWFRVWRNMPFTCIQKK